MSREADNPHYVRRVVLPSGKTIEVVYFDEIPAFPAVGDSGYTEGGDDLALGVVEAPPRDHVPDWTAGCGLLGACRESGD